MTKVEKKSQTEIIVRFLLDFGSVFGFFGPFFVNCFKISFFNLINYLFSIQVSDYGNIVSFFGCLILCHKNLFSLIVSSLFKITHYYCYSQFLILADPSGNIGYVKQSQICEFELKMSNITIQLLNHYISLSLIHI